MEGALPAFRFKGGESVITNLFCGFFFSCSLENREYSLILAQPGGFLGGNKRFQIQEAYFQVFLDLERISKEPRTWDYSGS